MDTINSLSLLRPQWKCWYIMGIAKDRLKYNSPYLFYAVFVNIFLNLLYPLQLGLVLFQNDSEAENIKNLAVCVICITSICKFFVFASKREKMLEAEGILQELDERVHTEVERDYFKTLRKSVTRISYVFLFSYFFAGLIAEMCFIFREDRGLLFPAWFPFDWHKSNIQYYMANMYQIVVVSLILIETYINDFYPATSLCLLSGHIKLLALRIAQIGYDDKCQLENELELQRCTKDHINLHRLFQLIQNIISLPLFIQFTVSAFNICIAMYCIMLYSTDFLERLYYSSHFAAMPLQIFPVCFYGSKLETLFGQLHYAVYSSNWVYQSRAYKKHMMLFTERSLKQTTASVYGIFSIHLTTFFAVCKGAYSLFALVVSVAN